MSAKILIVEDNGDSRHLLHFLFTQQGFVVVTAVDGTEGFYLAKAEKPDLIITDLMMPDISGIDLIRQLQAEPEIADTPVLIYSADRMGVMEAANEPGVRKAFTKPFDLDDLLQHTIDWFESADRSSDQ